MPDRTTKFVSSRTVKRVWILDKPELIYIVEG